MPKAKKKKYKPPLTTKQKAEIIDDYTNGMSINAIAKKIDRKWEIVNAVIKEKQDIVEIVETIKKETITEWIQNKTAEVITIGNLCLSLLPDKLKEASARDIIGVLKILLESFATVNNGNNDNTEIKDEITIEIVDNSGDDADG